MLKKNSDLYGEGGAAALPVDGGDFEFIEESFCACNRRGSLLTYPQKFLCLKLSYFVNAVYILIDIYEFIVFIVT